MKVLVIDVGGTHVKLMVSGQEDCLKLPSGRGLTAHKMVEEVKTAVKSWKYDAISIGYPGAVVHGKPALEPQNLGKGWVGFDFAHAFGTKVRIINDATMQALGSYKGGRMLFLGLGTGLGSTLILDEVIVPLELSHLHYSRTRSLETMVGKNGLERLGRKKWESIVHEIVEMLTAAFVTDYTVLGGGNAKKVKKLPPHVQRGANKNAFVGGERLWKGRAIITSEKEHGWVIA